MIYQKGWEFHQDTQSNFVETWSGYAILLKKAHFMRLPQNTVRRIMAEKRKGVRENGYPRIFRGLQERVGKTP